MWEISRLGWSSPSHWVSGLGGAEDGWMERMQLDKRGGGEIMFLWVSATIFFVVPQNPLILH